MKPLYRFIDKLIRLLFKAATQPRREPPRREARRAPPAAPAKPSIFRPSVNSWLTLPSLEAKTIGVPARVQGNKVEIEVNLGTMTCPCEEWVKRKKASEPTTSFGRCCSHLAFAVSSELRDRPGVNPWLLCALECATFFDPPTRFTSGVLSNGETDFLCLYNLDTGYVQVYGPLSDPQQCGYNMTQNRWGFGMAPKNPLILKKELRPWVRGLDERYPDAAKARLEKLMTRFHPPDPS